MSQTQSTPTSWPICLQRLSPRILKFWKTRNSPLLGLIDAAMNPSPAIRELALDIVESQFNTIIQIQQHRVGADLFILVSTEKDFNSITDLAKRAGNKQGWAFFESFPPAQREIFLNFVGKWLAEEVVSYIERGRK